MTKIHKFIVHSGRFENPERSGKGLWPDHLHLTISRSDTKRLVKQMLNWLFAADRADEGEDTFTFVGKLEHDIPEK